jgi:hypothetical protein
MVESLMERFQIKHNLSTPYHPQTNGLVERFNRTLCESLAKLSIDHGNEWDSYIAPTLFAYRTSRHATTKIAPFFLVYGREAKLPLDSLNLEEEQTVNDRIKILIDNIPQVREDARQRIELTQRKQKAHHDQRLKKETSFSISDKVLYYNAAQEKQWTGKLNPKWSGPYYVHQILMNGSYKLRTIEGNVLRTPMNGNLLKMYQDRQSWEPQLIIEDRNMV